MSPKKKILIVDDELFFREILKEALKDRFDIIDGKDGQEAVVLSIEHEPSLIIMDIEMPTCDGIEACRILKSNSKTRKIPIILFTSRTKKKDMVLGLKAGADDYITKPVYIPEIIARVDAHLRTTDLYSDLEHKDLLFLLEITETISAIRNPMTILRLIVEKMAEIIDVARCSIVSINECGDMVVKASNDLSGHGELKLDLHKYPEIQKSLKSKQAVIVNDIKNDPLMNSVREQIKNLEFNSIVVIPVVKKESVIGTFFLRTATPVKGGITDRIYKLSQLVANISANALENAILFESVQAAQEYFEEMAIRDGLTSLYNHRHFYDRLEEEFGRADRYAAPLSLVFFDIDDFKRINDNYGHSCGDQILKKIGQLMKAVARDSDIPARYGGEEFAVILPNTAEEGAFDVANRLHNIIREHQFDQLAPNEQITISSGISTFTNKNLESFNELVQLADSRMYAAKRAGKDKVAQL
ncbi:MAG: diguanylate cyclase [Deltaproteobacteria bacterium]|nr:diguanylate cyclase [Deltaproteobacteria bacterium]MCW8893422.1 diguanylate cyclase [Deltaproteobacteria bacterium]